MYCFGNPQWRVRCCFILSLHIVGGPYVSAAGIAWTVDIMRKFDKVSRCSLCKVFYVLIIWTDTHVLLGTQASLHNSAIGQLSFMLSWLWWRGVCRQFKSPTLTLVLAHSQPDKSFRENCRDMVWFLFNPESNSDCCVVCSKQIAHSEVLEGKHRTNHSHFTQVMCSVVLSALAF